MNATNHVTLGLAFGVTGAALGIVPMAPVAMVSVSLGALLPDIDTPYSSVGHFVPVLPKLIYAIGGHRGVTHSAVGIGGLAALLVLTTGSFQEAYEAWLWWNVGVPLLLGYASHLLGDYFTWSGIPVMWPDKKRHSYPIIRAGSLRWGSPSEIAVAWGALLMAATIYLSMSSSS